MLKLIFIFQSPHKESRPPKICSSSHTYINWPAWHVVTSWLVQSRCRLLGNIRKMVIPQVKPYYTMKLHFVFILHWTYCCSIIIAGYDWALMYSFSDSFWLKSQTANVETVISPLKTPMTWIVKMKNSNLPVGPAYLNLLLQIKMSQSHTHTDALWQISFSHCVHLTIFDLLKPWVNECIPILVHLFIIPLILFAQHMRCYWLELFNLCLQVCCQAVSCLVYVTVHSQSQMTSWANCF
jgi:hypothetical protein